MSVQTKGTSLADAIFESASGFTTTGASILSGARIAARPEDSQ